MSSALKHGMPRALKLAGWAGSTPRGVSGSETVPMLAFRIIGMCRKMTVARISASMTRETCYHSAGEVELMARSHGLIEDAAVRGKRPTLPARVAQSAHHGPSHKRSKLKWGSSSIAEEGDTTVEVDEATEADAWKLSIDTPACHISIQIDGSQQLDQFLEFLRRADNGHEFAHSGEFRVGPPWMTWVWDDEGQGRLFIWLNRSGKHSMRTVLDHNQIGCIRSALAEAARSR